SSVRATPGRRIAWIAAAAVLTLVISGTFLVNYFASSDNDLKEQLNDTGRNLTITLEDASKVILSPGSRLQYHAFTSTERNVILQGTGSFEVTKNRNAPFKVYSGGIVAVVLGTTFDVKNNSDSSVTVDLKTGSLRVAVVSNGMLTQELLLEPDQRAVFSNYRLVKFENAPKKNADKINYRHSIEFNKNDFLQ